MKQTRENWTDQIGFLMAAIGSAIGLGILWKFPYTVGENGGGLFLLSYLVCVTIVGVPLFIAEIILGRSSQRSAVMAFEYHDRLESGWKAIGWFGVLASFLIMSFYSVIAGWGMSYILMSLNGVYQNNSGVELQEVYKLLNRSGDITLLWHFFFTLITAAIVITGVKKGIERWAKIMTKGLLALLILLLCYTLTLDGFSKAVEFIFYPNIQDFKLSSVIEALGLAFWTLSIGQGIMISYGSYMKRSESIMKMSGIVAVVFTFNLPPQAGPGLIFQTLPYLFAQLPGSIFLSTIFFTLFVFTALTSAIPLVEVVATNLMDLYGLTRKRAVTLVGIATFLFGIPSAFSGTNKVFPEWKEIYGIDFLKTIDNLVSIWVIPIGGLLSSIFVGWVMDKKAMKDELVFGSTYRFLYHPWYFFMKWVVPVIIFTIIVQKGGLYNFDQLFRGF